MALLTQWTWVWVNSGSWWWTGRPGMLRFMGSQRITHDWASELNWSNLERASLIAQSVKNLPAMQEIQVWFLAQEDHLENGKATHFSILAWRIPWIEEPSKLQSMGLQESERTEQLNHHRHQASYKCQQCNHLTIGGKPKGCHYHSVSFTAY